MQSPQLNQSPQNNTRSYKTYHMQLKVVLELELQDHERRLLIDNRKFQNLILKKEINEDG